MALFTRLLGRAAGAGTLPPMARRALFRRLGGVGLAAIGAPLALTDRSWAAVEARAHYFGIEPGTLVDARGLPMRSPNAAGPYPCVGQLLPVGFNFASRGVALCEGQLLPISQYTALFSLLGTTYGGDGRTAFGLPDLRGRTPMHAGQGPGLTDPRLGQRGGSEHVTLTALSLPAHNHGFTVSTFTSPTDPENFIVVRDGDDRSEGARNLEMANTGGGQAHDNMPPFLVVNFCIALQGLFPSRN